MLNEDIIIKVFTRIEIQIPELSTKLTNIIWSEKNPVE